MDLDRDIDGPNTQISMTPLHLQFQPLATQIFPNIHEVVRIFVWPRPPINYRQFTPLSALISYPFNRPPIRLRFTRPFTRINTSKKSGIRFARLFKMAHNLAFTT